MTHGEEVGTFAGAFAPALLRVGGEGRAPCSCVISTFGMLNLNDFRPGVTQSRLVTAAQRSDPRQAAEDGGCLPHQSSTYPRSPRICVQYG